MAVQLISREWTISDGRGARHQVQGEGVVGEQPVIEPGASFDYVSGCPLQTPTGWMEGHYEMISADGRSFNAATPRSPLAPPPGPGSRLRPPAGWVEGRYEMISADGRSFNAAIPRFPLVAPTVAS